MADYYATARSNYFAVKDKDEFNRFCERWDLTWEKKTVDNFEPDFDGAVFPGAEQTLYAFFCNENGLNVWISEEIENENGEVEEVELGPDEFYEELAAHLLPEHVAVIMESGAEKMKHVGGFAVAVSSDGETVSVNLHDIYEKAAELGKYITEASY